MPAGIALRDWAETQAAVLPRYSLEDYRRDTIGQRIRRIVHISAPDAPDPVAETAWVQRLAEEHGAPHALIATADLGASNFAEILDDHAGASSLLRGVAVSIVNGTPIDDPVWRRGVTLLGRRKLVLELHMTAALMPRLLKLADAHRDVRFVLCHAGYPPKAGERSETAWRAGIRALAGCPNVVVKLSSLASNEGHWDPARFHLTATRLIDAFGPTRVIIGSGLPTEHDFVEPDTLFSAVREWVADLPLKAQSSILYENACAIYQMP